MINVRTLLAAGLALGIAALPRALAAQTSAPAAAQPEEDPRWVWLYDTDIDRNELDSETISRRLPGLYHAWIRVSYFEPQGDDRMEVALLHNEFDCDGRRFRVMRITGYRGEQVVMDTEDVPYQWIPAAPESAGERTLNAVCELGESRAR